MKKNVASQVIGAQMIAVADGSAFTGTVTVYVTGAGGSQTLGAVGSGVCTHEGNGFHTYLPSQSETNYDHVAFTFIGSGAVPATIQVYTSFPQTGDGYALLGAPAGASMSADLAAIKSDTGDILTDTGTTLSNKLDAIDDFVDDLESRLGTPTNLGSGATIAANLADIESQTDDIGAAGAGLSNIPWNASWDTQVQSEVEDALIVNRLDELMVADSDIDGAAPPTVGSVFHELMSASAGSFTYDQTTDSLEAIRVRGDSAWTEVSAGEIRSAVGLASANLDTQLADLPTNSELTTALAAADDAVLAAIAALNNISAADVNAQVVDALATDTYGESSGVPNATASLVAKIQWLATLARNKITQTSTTQTLRNDADDGDISTSTHSDSAGTYTRGEWS